MKISKHRILSGRKHKFAISPVRYAYWEKEVAQPNEQVKMFVEMPMLPGRQEALISIYEKDEVGNDDLIEENLRIELNDGKGSRTWEVRYIDDYDDIPEKQYIGEFENDEDREEQVSPSETDWNAPEYYFKVKCGDKKGQSSILKYKEDLEIEISEYSNEPIKYGNCLLIFLDGIVKTGEIKEGILKIENVPPFSFILHIEGFTDIEIDE